MEAASNALSAAHAFEIVWSTLVGVLGPGATAAVFRRAVRLNANRMPVEAQGLDIIRDGLDYKFVLPPSWSDVNEPSLQALRDFVRAKLCPLLEELTGQIVIGMLARQPELQTNHILDRCEPRGHSR